VKVRSWKKQKERAGLVIARRAWGVTDSLRFSRSSTRGGKLSLDLRQTFMKARRSAIV